VDDATKRVYTGTFFILKKYYFLGYTFWLTKISQFAIIYT
jgi:hypothetical protein